MTNYYEAIPQIAAPIQGRGLARGRFVAQTGAKLRGPVGTDDSVSAREQSHTDISGRKGPPALAASIAFVVSHRLHLWLHCTIDRYLHSVLAEPLRKCFP
jgi:hypothetical protein